MKDLLVKPGLKSRIERIEHFINSMAVIAKPAPKPRLELKPRWLSEEQRLLEIASAASRYLEDGKQIPNSWIEEMVHLIGRMEFWRAWQKRDGGNP